MRVIRRGGPVIAYKSLFRRHAIVRNATVTTLIFLAGFMGAKPANAQRISLRRFDISDGLANSNVRSIFQDRKGYIWFGTSDGLSRFDGYRFFNYGSRSGLSNTVINSIAEDHNGNLWVATNGGGVALFSDRDSVNQKLTDPLSSTRMPFSMFAVGPSNFANRVNQIFIDSRGDGWALTDGGIYRSTLASGRPSFQLVLSSTRECHGAEETADGHLWFGLGDELAEVDGGGNVLARIPIQDGGASRNVLNDVVDLSREERGDLLVATGRNVYRFSDGHPQSGERNWRTLFAAPANLLITAAIREPGGDLWLGTADGLIQDHFGVQRKYGPAEGLGVDFIHDLFRDRDANLWIATEGGGVYRLGGESITNYTQEMGLPHPLVSGVLESAEGQIFADYTYSPADELVELGSHGVRRRQGLAALPLQGSAAIFTHNKSLRGWNVFLPLTTSFSISAPAIKLRSGRLVDVSKLAGARSDVSICIYEDDAGGLWYDLDDKTLNHIDSAGLGNLRHESFPADFVLTKSGGHPLLIDDRSGGLWLGGVERLARLRNGQLTQIGATDGLPKINPLCFYMDSRGWLWIGSRGAGVSVTKEPGSDHPVFQHFSTDQSLSSDFVASISEDAFGQMYFGTSRGLDRFNPATSDWRSFTTREGLAGNRIFRVIRDRSGNIWVATSDGVSKITPRAPTNSGSPQAVYVSRVTVAGEDLAIPERGASLVPKFQLPATRNNLTVEFVAPQPNSEAGLRYQYRLQGADSDWGAPTMSRAVTYARLAPGTYKFLVRAVTAAGVESTNPATIEFQILPPAWRSWWFISLVLVFIASATYSLYRYRIGRLLELQRIRMRIATDLHDDIGSNLSLIAMASDVASRALPTADAQTTASFALIANTSRTTVDAMSDIVWAVNPGKDHVGDLTHRMRRTAGEVFATNNIAFEIRGAESDYNRIIPADKRREIYMIFKEAVHNIARHSHCQSVGVDLALSSGHLQMTVADDGIGFDLSKALDGNGLAGMRRRAANVGGTIVIESTPQKGTTLVLRIPLDRRMNLRDWVTT